ARVARAAVDVIAVGALDVAHAPLGALGERDVAPLAEAIWARDRAVLGPDLAFAEAGRAGGGLRLVHDGSALRRRLRRDRRRRRGRSSGGRRRGSRRLRGRRGRRGGRLRGRRRRGGDGRLRRGGGSRLRRNRSSSRLRRGGSGRLRRGGFRRGGRGLARAGGLVLRRVELTPAGVTAAAVRRLGGGTGSVALAHGAHITIEALRLEPSQYGDCSAQGDCHVEAMPSVPLASTAVHRAWLFVAARG